MVDVFYLEDFMAYSNKYNKEEYIEKKKEEIDKLESILKDGVKEVFSSGKWKEFLDTMSKFYNYSPRNCMLIKRQLPTASLVASFREWNKEFERTVNKGEKALYILAPIQKKYNQIVKDADGKPLKDENGYDLTKEVKRIAFKSVPVFDISQTSGKELPTIALKLEKDFEDKDKYNAFLRGLIQLAPVPVSFEQFKSNADGYYSPTEQKIVVQKDLSEYQKIGTLIHEMAHSMLHNPKLNKDISKLTNQDMEVQAESLAYIVCKHFGIDTSQYSFGYVASWSKNEKNLEEKFSKVLNPVKELASEIITKMEDNFEHNLEKVKLQNKYMQVYQDERLSDYEKHLIYLNAIKGIDTSYYDDYDKSYINEAYDCMEL